ncbi:MAG: aminotransferase class V-fold PLP-dependent enzyme [Solobacterium sp.]|nr:aminotransferase class V-fold PLP-dependent enzyme [Solobacterium sp.]
MSVRFFVLVVFAGHKSFYATFGTAGFIQISNKPLKVIKCGGTGSDSLNPDMPKTGHARFETGSINSVSIAGLNAGIDWVLAHDIYTREKELTEYLIDKLGQVDKVHVYLPEAKDRIFGLVSISVDGYLAGDVGSILDEEYEICVRTGYHCSPYIHDFLGSIIHGGTVRISMSAFTTREEINSLVDALATL